MRLVAQNNKADGVNFTPITVVALIDPELLENLIDMEEIDAESVEDRPDESVMEFLDLLRLSSHFHMSTLLEKRSCLFDPDPDPCLGSEAPCKYRCYHILLDRGILP
jgi:hypothetical protein